MKDFYAALNNTAVPYRNNTNLSILIDATGDEFPHKTAVVYRDKSLTYVQLIEGANRFAAYLLQNGIKPGDIIGLAAECSIEMLICMIGLLKAGATYVPIDPTYPQDRVEFMLQDSAAKMLLVSQDYKNKFQSTAASVVIEEIWAEVSNFPSANITVSENGNDLAYILYTSGSTGRPKGVEITHRNLVNLLTSIKVMPGITPEDRLLAITTICFDIAGLELFLPLITGAELVICDVETSRDGRLLLDLLEKKDISIMQATPSTWRMMIDSGWEQKFPIKAFCGGEPLPEHLAKALLERTSALWNMYGPTETTIYSIIKNISMDDEIITIGRPIQNTQVYILDEQQQVVDPEITGEIFIGGDGVAAGYLNQQALTEVKFIKDPFSTNPDARLYKTGDLAKLLPSGDILYQGRIDQQVKIRGHRIETGEIESVLMDQEGVKQALVMAREDNPGDKRLAAYLLLSDSKTAIANLKDILKLKLPSYMVPNDYVVLEAFPMTPNYKIDKNALPKPYRIPADVDIAHQPKGEMQKMLLAIWSGVLGINDISIKDNFFDLGGHSILAVRVMAAIEQQTGTRLPLAILFDHSTIEKLAEKLTSATDEKWQSLVVIQPNGNKVPLYLIHGGGLNVILFKSITNYLDPTQPVYGFQALGLNKPTQLPQRIEEIASIYIAELIESNPTGPYCLVGYSLGGFIAYEMSRQLIAMGKQVSLLGMMDTFAGNNDTHDGKIVRLVKKLMRQLKKVPFVLQSLIRFPKETTLYQLNAIKERFSSKDGAALIPDGEYFSAYEKEIYQTYKDAQHNYSLQPMDIEINLFKVSKRLYFLEDLKYLGWSRYAKKGMKVHNVPGDHKTFIYPPHDREFAAILQAVLNQQ